MVPHMVGEYTLLWVLRGTLMRVRPQDSLRGVDNLAKSMERNSRRGKAKKWHGEDRCTLSLCSLCLVSEVIMVNKLVRALLPVWKTQGPYSWKARQERVNRGMRRNLRSRRRSLAPYCWL